MANKVAVITGGAGGIGKAVVLRLVQVGFDICIVDQNEQFGEVLRDFIRQQGCNAEFDRLDLRQSREVKIVFDRIYARARCIDLLVNLAGGTLHKHPIAEFPLSEWREVIDVNLKGTFLSCQAVCQRIITRFVCYRETP